MFDDTKHCLFLFQNRYQVVLSGSINQQIDVVVLRFVHPEVADCLETELQLTRVNPAIKRQSFGSQKNKL